MKIYPSTIKEFVERLFKSWEKYWSDIERAAFDNLSKKLTLEIMHLIYTKNIITKNDIKRIARIGLLSENEALQLILKAMKQIGGENE